MSLDSRPRQWIDHDLALRRRCQPNGSARTGHSSFFDAAASHRHNHRTKRNTIVRLRACCLWICFAKDRGVGIGIRLHCGDRVEERFYDRSFVRQQDGRRIYQRDCIVSALRLDCHHALGGQSGQHRCQRCAVTAAGKHIARHARTDSRRWLIAGSHISDLWIAAYGEPADQIEHKQKTGKSETVKVRDRKEIRHRKQELQGAP